MSILSLPMSLDDLELAWLKESYSEGLGKTGKCICQRNYVKNPSAEVDALATGAIGAGTVITRDTVEKFTGSASFKVVTNGVVNDGIVFYMRSGVNAFAVGKYCAAIRIKGSPGDQFYIEGRVVINSSNVYQSTGSKIITCDGTWQVFDSLVLDLTLPSYNSSSHALNIRQTGAGVKTVYIDSAIFANGSDIPSYFDGDSVDNNVWTYEWEGTPHNSSSIKWAKEPIYAENLIVDPYFVNKTTNPVLGGWALYKSSAPLISVFDSEIPSPPPCGGPVLKVVNDGTATAYCYIAASWAGVGGAGASAIRQGVTYTLSYYIRQRSGTPTTCGLLSVSNGAGSNAAFPIVANSSGGAISSEWKRVVRTGVAAVDNAIDNIIWINIPNGVWEIEIAGVAINIGSNPVVIPQEMAVWRGSVSNSPSAMYDVNARDLAYIEKAYWAKLSGLSEPASLADHKLAALRANIKTVAGDPLTVVTKNYLVNPSFENGLTSWTYAASSWTTVVDSVSPHSRSQCVKATRTALTSPYPLYATANNFIELFDEGESVVGSIWVKGEGTSIGKVINMYLFFSNSGDKGIPLSLAITLQAGWTQYKVVGNVPTGFGPLRPYLLFNANNLAVGEVLYADDAVISKVDVGYFDGTTSGLTRWSGAADSSYAEMVDGSKNSITDLWVSYLMSRSGLSPASKYALHEHELAFYKSQLGL